MRPRTDRPPLCPRLLVAVGLALAVAPGVRAAPQVPDEPPPLLEPVPDPLDGPPEPLPRPPSTTPPKIGPPPPAEAAAPSTTTTTEGEDDFLTVLGVSYGTGLGVMTVYFGLSVIQQILNVVAV